MTKIYKILTKNWIPNQLLEIEVEFFIGKKVLQFGQDISSMTYS